MRGEYFLVIFGRILLSLLFILSGLSKIGGWTELSQQMAAKGIPLVPFFLAAALIVELVGGLALLFGWQARWGAWLLFLYLIPTTLIMHNFWTYSGAEQQLQLIHFLKNLAVMGGLLLVPAQTRDRIAAGERPEPMQERPVRPRAA